MPTAIFKAVLDSLAEASPLLLVALAVYMWMEFRAIRHEIAEIKAQAKEDRERNERDHDRLFRAVEGLQGAVAGLQSNVQVLLDRSDRSGAQGSGGTRE